MPSPNPTTPIAACTQAGTAVVASPSVMAVVLMTAAGTYYRAGGTPQATCASPVPNPNSPVSAVLIDTITGTAYTA